MRKNKLLKKVVAIVSAVAMAVATVPFVGGATEVKAASDDYAYEGSTRTETEWTNNKRSVTWDFTGSTLTSGSSFKTVNGTRMGIILISGGDGIKWNVDGFGIPKGTVLGMPLDSETISGKITFTSTLAASKSKYVYTISGSKISSVANASEGIDTYATFSSDDIVTIEGKKYLQLTAASGGEFKLISEIVLEETRSSGSGDPDPDPTPTGISAGTYDFNTYADEAAINAAGFTVTNLEKNSGHGYKNSNGNADGTVKFTLSGKANITVTECEYGSEPITSSSGTVSTLVDFDRSNVAGKYLISGADGEVTITLTKNSTSNIYLHSIEIEYINEVSAPMIQYTSDKKACRIVYPVSDSVIGNDSIGLEVNGNNADETYTGTKVYTSVMADSKKYVAPADSVLVVVEITDLPTTYNFTIQPTVIKNNVATAIGTEYSVSSAN